MNNLPGPIDLIKRSIQIFFKKGNFIYFLKIYLVLLPSSIFLFFQESFTIPFESFVATYVWLVPAALIFSIAYLAVGFWVGASGIVAVRNVIDGSELSFKSTYASAWRVLGKFALLQMLLGLVIGLGFIFLIIPGILFLVWYYFAGFELITKGSGIRESIGASKRLSSGRFWRILGRFLVFGFFGMLVQIVFSIIPFGIGSAILPLFGALFILPYFLLYKELSLR